MSSLPCRIRSCTGLASAEQAQQVGHAAARAADGGCRGLVRHAELVDQALDALCFLDRVEVLALDVLDQRHGQRELVAHVAHQHRHRVQPGELRRTPAPLTGDDLELPVLHRANQDRLDHALRLDRVGQIGDRVRIHLRARLIAAGPQAGERQLRSDGPAACGSSGASSASRPRPRPLTLTMLVGYARSGCGWRESISPASAR